MRYDICKILEENDGRIEFNTLLGIFEDINPIEIELNLDRLKGEGLITTDKGVISLVKDHNPAPVVEDKTISSVPIPGSFARPDYAREENLNTLNYLCKDSVTSRLIKTIKNDGFVKCSNNGLLYRYYNGVYKRYTNEDYNMYIEREVSPNLDNELVANVRTLAVTSLGVYKPIHHNILAFTNGYYNTDSCEFTSGNYTEGIPYYTFNIDYNPDAEPEEYFRKYWNNYSEELQNQLLELVACLLMKGNPHKKLFMLVGQGNVGKSVFVSILNYVLESTSELDLATIVKGGHELSDLLHSNVNFCNDEQNLTVGDNAMLKKFTGNDRISVNAKYKDPVTLKGNDVPKLVVIANNMVKFKNNERAMIDRLGIIKMYLKNPIDNSEKDELLHEKIIAETSSLEWLIFNALEKLTSLKEYYRPDWDMSFKTDQEVYDSIAVLSEPVRYFLEKGFNYTGESNNFEMDYADYRSGSLDDHNGCSYVTEDDLQEYLHKACALEKVQINKTRNNGKVNPKSIHGYIDDVFGVRKYNYKRIRVDGERTRVYYFLETTDYYHKVMNQ